MADSNQDLLSTLVTPLVGKAGSGLTRAVPGSKRTELEAKIDSTIRKAVERAAEKGNPVRCELCDGQIREIAQLGDWRHWQAIHKTGVLVFCVHCSDAAPGSGETTYAGQSAEDRIENRVRLIVPQAFWAARLGDFDADIQDQAQHFVVAVRKWMARGLNIAGPPGTGKTHLACALCRHFAEVGYSVRFMGAREAMREVRATYAPGAEKTEQRVIDELASLDILVLDDLGREGKSTEALLATLVDVLDARSRRTKPTIITGNLTPQELHERYDEAIASRLKAFQPLVLVGVDRRGD